ncbi:MAG: nucleotidyltransferase domain-containing protein [Armatimonadota bacterium]|nr:nucleotidyltransferase domain-containing protein [Armatimonadota bacterium]MDR7570573.1 nucleotidyltransferase domain-containing protein [Armatimonadota bacterium]MDR7614248.1 nucleotidyltransferase domain-containing protein [Armatimonadota bacterium]
MERRSYGSVRVYWLNREEAWRRLEEAARRVVEERPEVKAVVLFGSLAEGRAVPGSDADLLLLLRSSDRPWMERPSEYLPYFEGIGLPLDLFCYTEEEVEQVPLARHALSRGRRLAGR